MDFFIFLGLAIIAIVLLVYGFADTVKLTHIDPALPRYKKDPKTGQYFEVDEKGNKVHPEYIEQKVSLKIKKNKFLHNSSNSFWHGQKGLALTFWCYFFGGNIFFNVLTLIFRNNFTLMMMILVFFIIWNVLSVMGVFNAADIYKAEKIKQGLTYTPATAAKVAVVLLILSGIGNSIPR